MCPAIPLIPPWDWDWKIYLQLPINFFAIHVGKYTSSVGICGIMIEIYIIIFRNDPLWMKFLLFLLSFLSEKHCRCWHRVQRVTRVAFFWGVTGGYVQIRRRPTWKVPPTPACYHRVTWPKMSELNDGSNKNSTRLGPTFGCPRKIGSTVRINGL